MKRSWHISRQVRQAERRLGIAHPLPPLCCFFRVLPSSLVALVALIAPMLTYATRLQAQAKQPLSLRIEFHVYQGPDSNMLQ